MGGVDGFDAVVRALSGTPLVYNERSSPRSTIKGQVYTSTDYPPSEDLSAQRVLLPTSWPLHLYFHCLQPPTTLGATPLADIRRVYETIDPDVVREFAARKWMVVRNFNGMFGVSWQQVFNSDDPATVQAYCAAHAELPEIAGADGSACRHGCEAEKLEHQGSRLSPATSGCAVSQDGRR